MGDDLCRGRSSVLKDEKYIDFGIGKVNCIDRYIDKVVGSDGEWGVRFSV